MEQNDLKQEILKKLFEDNDGFQVTKYISENLQIGKNCTERITIERINKIFGEESDDLSEILYGIIKDGKDIFISKVLIMDFEQYFIHQKENGGFIFNVDGPNGKSFLFLDNKIQEP